MIKKPFDIRSKYDYEKAENIVLQLSRTSTPPSSNYRTWYSDTEPYEYVKGILDSEINYFKKKMKEYKQKHPEEFI